MKKILFFIILAINSLISFAADDVNIKDYKIFASGKNFLSQNNYKDALTQFELLSEKYPESLLFKSNYANYYIGITYYNLGDYDNARNFLERAIYTPKDFKAEDPYFQKSKKHLFEYKRNYYLAKIYLEQGLKDEALKHFKFLVKNYYSKELETYEKMALKELEKHDPYFEILYMVKYENALPILLSLKNEDILALGDFFLSKGSYQSAEKVYSEYLNLEKKDVHQVKLSLLETLKRSKKYDVLLEKSSDFITLSDNSDFYYYLALAQMQLGKKSDAEQTFSKVKTGKYKKAASISIARILSSRREYKKAISILKSIKSSYANNLLMETYIKAGMTEEFKKASVNYIKKYPYSDQAAYYRFLLYKESQNPNYLNWIIKYNINTYYYELAYSIMENMRNLEAYPLNYKSRIYREKVQRLESLAELKDGEILKIEIENMDFPEKDRVFREYLMSSIYEKGGFYLSAVLKSRKYQNDFSKYSNLITFLYPRYYDFMVKKAAKKYNIEEALIYSVILQESVFEPSLISKAGATGLMQIMLSTAKDMDPDITQEKLLAPDINIELGSRYLKSLLTKFDGNIPKTVAAYNAGAGNVVKWKSDKKGDLDIEKIPFSETKKYVKRVINNYYKYKRIYHY
ncbi:transglycosylase SLT domain-containing protein [Ilyobacter polytropus]|uniref:Lytic transglycosylase catalytic n=1 Tax=Ilyobacter polytropus (strain ATCC 51220 / DSM 2926 / LMG 16218 / CuHBu1) TaxID=572544 RepID=E3H5Z2_ILYPC|nr:transglycosylase SLT domain-containing protein [Ilyobacter polytropus]ADO82282.1 Lytic transglycosylase catalytic [Ilyobacter polytropus DSM 2926]